MLSSQLCGQWPHNLISLISKLNRLIVRALHGQLSWYYYLVLIKIADDQERAFYQQQSALHSWSYRELNKQIKNELYENTSRKDIQAVFQTQLPAVEPQRVFKETYDFKFIEFHTDPDEKELQDKILANLITFLKELGEDFCIRGSQVPIKIDGETHHIDLVLYHCGKPIIRGLRISVEMILKLLSSDLRIKKYYGINRILNLKTSSLCFFMPISWLLARTSLTAQLPKASLARAPFIESDFLTPIPFSVILAL